MALNGQVIPFYVFIDFEVLCCMGEGYRIETEITFNYIRVIYYVYIEVVYNTYIYICVL